MTHPHPTSRARDPLTTDSRRPAQTRADAREPVTLPDAERLCMKLSRADRLRLMAYLIDQDGICADVYAHLVAYGLEHGVVLHDPEQDGWRWDSDYRRAMERIGVNRSDLCEALREQERGAA